MVDSQRHGNFLWLYPSPKGNEHESPSNYRPISLQSVTSKLLERHFHQLITDHLSVNHPLANTQWGVQPAKSTVSALLSTTYDWLEEMEAGRDICSVFLDLKKAFDTVHHREMIVVVVMVVVVVVWANQSEFHTARLHCKMHVFVCMYVCQFACM